MFLTIPLISCNYGKKIKRLKYSKYLFVWSGRFHTSKINSRTNLFQVEGSDVRQNLQFNFCNYYVKNIILGLVYLFPSF